MSSFTEAGFEPVMLADGKQKTREGRKVYRIKGRDGNGFVFYIGPVKADHAVHIREGFETDELSIPDFRSKGLLKLLGLVTWVIPQWVRKLGQVPAALHDYLCEHPDWPRNDADAQFWAALCAVNMPYVWRKVLFDAVILNKSKERYNDPTYFDDQLALPLGS